MVNNYISFGLNIFLKLNNYNFFDFVFSLLQESNKPMSGKPCYAMALLSHTQKTS